MKLMDEKIWQGFFKFGLTAQAFNKLPRDEKVKHLNTLKFSIKESLSQINSFAILNPDELRRVFRQVDKRVHSILFS